jgi:hypothetical protein
LDVREPRPNQQVTTDDAIARGHEGTEVNMRGIVYAVVGLFVAGGAALIVSWVVMRGFERSAGEQDPPRSPLASQTQPPPAPWLQPSLPQGTEPRQPWQDTSAYLKHEETGLASYRVVDAKAGVVQIPIERAMLILAAPTTGPTTRPESTGGLPR